MSTPDKQYDEAVKLKDAGDLDGAVAILQKNLEVDPNHILSHSALAVYQQKLGRFDEAIAHAKKVVELEPADPFSYRQLSVICQRCGRIAEAEEALAREKVMQGGFH